MYKRQAGNHAQGVALAASKMRIKATIVMQLVTPLIKVDSTKSYGADVVLHGNIYDEAYGKAVDLAEENGYTFVHPYNDYDVMCGQGTIALEILEEMADIDQILVPVGGGGLISGIALAAKAIKPTMQVILSLIHIFQSYFHFVTLFACAKASPDEHLTP